MPFLQTKLYIPSTRPKLVPRLRLIEQLIEGLHRKMTLISAPAGFGKTTLVSEWVDHLRLDAAQESPIERGIAWVSLDESDNDPARFLAYVIAALQIVETRQVPDGSMGVGALSALQSSQRPNEAVLTALINEVAAIPDRILLVFDDYHVIDAQPVHDALTFLLRHLPPQMHLVIATREDPHLPLPRLRARGQLTELRAADLRFTSAEAAEFLNQVMGLDLSAEDIAALEARTEGWIAGLQLAAISMQGRQDIAGFIASFTGSHRFVLDYLVEEVLEQQSESVQTFLLCTSILDRLCGPLCDAVLRRGGGLHPTPPATGQELLKYLEHANLFIVPLDNERRWYRYHHLFADLLRGRLGQSQPDTVAELHVKASDWFERNHLVTEAVNHALVGRDYDRAARLVENNTGDLFQRAELHALLNWLKSLPDELARTRPWLGIYQAWVSTAWMLTYPGQLDRVDTMLQDVERLMQSDDASMLSPTEEIELLGNMAAMRAYGAVVTGNLARAIELADLAEETLTEKSLWACAAVQWARGAANRIEGDLEVAGQSLGQVVKLGKAMGDIWTTVIGMTELAIVYREQGQQYQHLRQTRYPQPEASGCQGKVFGDLALHLAAWVPGIVIVGTQSQRT